MLVRPIAKNQLLALRAIGLQSHKSTIAKRIQQQISPNVQSRTILRPFSTRSTLLFKNTFANFEGSNNNSAGGGNKKKNDKNDKDKNNKNNKKNDFSSWQPSNSVTVTCVVLGLVVLSDFLRVATADSTTPLSFQDFKVKYLEKGLVKKIYVVNKSYVEAELIENSGFPGTNASVGSASSLLGGPQTVRFTIGSVDFFEEQLDLVQQNLGIPSNERIPVSYVEKTSWMSYVLPFIPTALLLGGLYWITFKMRSSSKGTGSPGSGGGLGGLFNVGKSKAKLFNQEHDIKVKFKDVAGCDEAKEEIMEFVQFLKFPHKYERLGAKIPRGAILSGPPGTGKTLLAKATAGEAGVPFLSVSGSEFVEMFVGVGASRVRDLFQQARKMAPAIIFVDEIDAIGKERSKSGMGANDEKEATLNQLLVEMDGFESSDHVVVLAGTNRSDILDKALLRPGRFDRHITIDRPDIEGRKEIYKVYLKKITLKDEITDDFAGKLAALTPGFAGADIANVCNEAALFAARKDSPYVEIHHFEAAIERVIAGLEKKSKVLSPEEKKTVAYHEAGHAICGWYLEYADPLLKVSIIPRGQGALGYAQYLPGDQYLISERQFLHRMIMALGGRVSEELHFDSVTTGASDDFSKVTRMATAMITRLGMSKKLGTITFENDKNQGGYQVHKPFSERTADAIDQEIKRIVEYCHTECTNLLKDKIEEVDKVAQLLLEKEVLSRDDMVRLLGERPFATRNEAFEKYIEK